MSFFVNECFVCKATDSAATCSRCYMISYCGPVHQKKDWPKHKEFCDVIWALVREKKISHIYETLSDVDSDTWIKERKQMLLTVKSKLKRPLLLQEEQMLLMPRSCFVCHDTRQELLTTCPNCFCANFCAEHPFSPIHEKDCLSLKLFREFDSKMQNPAKSRTIFSLLDNITETTRFEDSSQVPHSMKEYLEQQIKGEDHILEQACVSNILSMSLTLFNAIKKLNLQSASEIFLHIRCNVTDTGIWELLLHFLPNLQHLHIVFIEQRESRKLIAELCDDCVSENKKMIIETNELPYKNYVKVKIYKKPNIFAYLNAELSKNDENVEWKLLLENLSRLGIPLVLTCVTEKMAKVVSENLRSTFWSSLICYKGPNDFGALEPLREWTDGGVSKINQLLIITKGRTIQCKAGFFHNISFLSKKRKESSRSPLVFFYTNVCHVCRSENISTYCKYCNMIFYCSEPHRQEDWSKHKELCQVIQLLLKKSGMKSIFDGEIDLMGDQKTDSESWLRAKLNLISKTESQLGKKLWVYQQQMFFFPKSCFVCHECDFSKLKTCECGINLCKRHNYSSRHSEICKDFHLGLQLFEKGKLPDQLPKSKYISGVKEDLPSSMKKFIDSQLILQSEATAEDPDFSRVVIGELLTKPLSLVYAIKKLMIPEFRKDNDSENSTIVVHVIGSKNTENVYYEFWDVIFNFLNVETLNISFVGSETTMLNVNCTFPDVQEKYLNIKSYPVDYEQFVQSSFFVNPDIVVGYNLDIHECGNEKCSCKEDILTIRKLNLPFVMTSGSKERAQKDQERLSKILDGSTVYDFCELNPFASLVPERDFETECLRFSNKYLLIYSSLDQTSENSKLRKYLLESLEAKRLADDSHLSDFEKALRAMKIENAPISSNENAESKTKSSNPRDGFLFNAARHELRYMLRNFRSISQSDGCSNSGSKIDSGAKNDKSGVESPKDKLSENLFPTQDSEDKLESESAVDEDSESKSESGSAPTLKLFKENVFSTNEVSEYRPELETEDIWNKIFEENNFSVEDSLSELESGYSKVETDKNLCFTAEQDLESKSESESSQVEALEEDLFLKTENSKFKLESVFDKEIFRKNVLSTQNSERKSESRSETISNNEVFKENISSTSKDSESKLKPEVGSVDIFEEDFLAKFKDSELKSELKSSKKEREEISTEDAKQSESKSTNLETWKGLFSTTKDSESRAESEPGKIKIFEEVLLTATDDFERKSESELTDDILLKSSTTEYSESKLKPEVDSVEIFEKDFLAKIEVSKLKSELECSKNEREEISTEDAKQSEYKSTNLEIWKGLFSTTKDSESRAESELGKIKIFEEVLLTATDDSERKSESGSVDCLIMEKSLLNSSTEGLECNTKTKDSESNSEFDYPMNETLEDGMTKDIENKFNSTEDLVGDLETGSFNDLLINVNLISTTDFNLKSESESLKKIKGSESKLESVPPENELFQENFLPTEDFESTSGSANTTLDLKEYLLSLNEDFVSKSDVLVAIENSESKSESKDSNATLDLATRILSLTENSRSKSEYGSVNTAKVSIIKNSLVKSESGSSNGETLRVDLMPKIEDFELESESKSGFANGEILECDFLPTTEDSESKSEFGSDKIEIGSTNGSTLNLEDSESLKEEMSKSELGTTNDNILKEDLTPSTADSEFNFETGFANGETSKKDLLSITEISESKSESGSYNITILKDDLSTIENSGLKLSNDETLKNDLLSTAVEFEIKSESGSAIENTLNLEDSTSKSHSESLKEEMSKSESGTTNGNVLKEDLFPITENSESNFETGFANGETSKKDLLSITEISESKSESVSYNITILKDDLSTIENSGSKLSKGETFKKDLLSNAVESKIKSESGSANDNTLNLEDSAFKSESEFLKEEISKSESGSANGNVLKEDLLPITEDFESKSESESKAESGSVPEEISEKNLLSSVEYDFELNSESEIENDKILKNVVCLTNNSDSRLKSGSGEVNIFKEDLFPTDDIGSKTESGTIENKFKVDLSPTTRDFEDFELKSEFDSSKVIEDSFKLESGSANVEMFEEDSLLTTENSESKSETAFGKDDMFKNVLRIEDFESKSEPQTIEENLKSLSPTTEDFEDFELKSKSESSKDIQDTFKLEPGSANVQIFEEDLLLMTENSKTKSETASGKDKMFKNILRLENFDSKSEPETIEENLKSLSPKTEDLEDFELKSESESSKDIEDSLKLEPGSANVEIFEEDFKGNLLPIEDLELKKNLVSMTGDSECKSESGPTDNEFLTEIFLLKEEIRRLKENEKLIKFENSQLKDEIRRLREVQN